jgi:ribose transport system substrate-binding protein
MIGMTRGSALGIGAAALALAAWQPAAAQDKGTIYYMIPTLLDELQTREPEGDRGRVRRDGL